MNRFNPNGDMIYNVLSGLGQKFGNVIQHKNQETKLKGLLTKAQEGDEGAIYELAQQDPQLAAFTAQQIEQGRYEMAKSMWPVLQKAKELGSDTKSIRALLSQQAEGAPRRIQKEYLDTANMDDDAMLNDIDVAYRGLVGEFGGGSLDKVGRFRTVELPNGDVISLDSATDQTRIIAEAEEVDLSPVPEEMRPALEKQPREIQRKVVEQFSTPSGKKTADEANEKDKKAETIKSDAISLVQDLLSDMNTLRRNVGPIDSETPTLRPESKDFKNKIERLKNILTAENLGMMTGVLSETDLKVIADIAGGGLKLDGSEDALISELHNLLKKFGSQPEEKALSLDDLVNQYAD